MMEIYRIVWTQYGGLMDHQGYDVLVQSDWVGPQDHPSFSSPLMKNVNLVKDATVLQFITMILQHHRYSPCSDFLGEHMK